MYRFENSQLSGGHWPFDPIDFIVSLSLQFGSYNALSPRNAVLSNLASCSIICGIMTG